MNYRLRILFLAATFIALILGISTFLDSDIETLSKIKTEIVVNQVGYLPQWQKTALLINNQNPTAQIKLINSDTKKLVATMTSIPEIQDDETGDRLSEIDFSSITEPGKYYLKQGKLKSAPFKIGNEIYQQPLVTLLRSYYLQRCGVEIDDPITGISHLPCHLKDGILAHQDQYHQVGDNLAALGGWHNGEGYSKYVATTTVTIARLLNLYQQQPDLFPDGQLGIPESGNDISDLLDEMQFGLDWLLKMQRADGAVYPKLAGRQWSIAIAPDEDIQTRYIYGISTPETAKFAAVMAIASRTYQSLEAQLAAKYLNAAESAWQYLQTQPEMKIDWVEGDDNGSIKYLASEFDTEKSLQTDIDDRLWAAVELYITTGKLNFADYFAANLDQTDYSLFSWKNPAPLALIDYLRQEDQPTSEELATTIKTKIQQRADLLLAKVNKSAYHIANDNFIWNSNRMTAEEGITLVYAYILTQNKDYLNAAIDQLDYILGRNYFNQTFITDIGTKHVKHINHPFAVAKKIIIPGLVVGGPNSDAQDGMVAKNQGQLSYIDDARSYSTNQYAIDNNASLISLIVNLTAQN
ncbi:MAG: glycoside hydrolase family 9 protein [Waterburya sp.]